MTLNSVEKVKVTFLPLPVRTVAKDQEIINEAFHKLVRINAILDRMHMENRRVMTMHIPGTFEKISELFTKLLRYFRIIK